MGIAIVSVIVMLLLICANIFMRYIMRLPINGAFELTQMLMICITTSIACCVFEGQHVWIDLLTQKLSFRVQVILDLITLIASAIITALISWRAYEAMLYSISNKRVYSTLRIPQWPFQLIFCLAMGFTALAILVYLIDRMMVYSRGEKPGKAASSSPVKNQLSEKEGSAK